MADLCEGQDGTTYQATARNCLGNCQVTANVNLNGYDYLIQPLRVNQNGGYCNLAYGGPFWQQNWGYAWSPVGDWSYGNYKGECETGQPLIGVSAYNEAQAHAVLCGSGPTSMDFAQSSSCYARYFGAQIGNNEGDASDGNWDSGYYLAGCQANEFVAGVSQTVPGDPYGAGRVNGILCCPSTNPGVRHLECTREVFYGQNSADFGWNDTDWDWGYDKGQCAVGSYVAGISSVKSNGYPHALLCCEP
jgi:hypothetical protein